MSARNSKLIPTKYHTVTPYITAQGTDKLISFLEQVFQAEVSERVLRPDGTIGHAEVKVGDSITMLSEANSQWPPMPAAIHMYVDDTDATYQTALKLGATSLMEPADQFHGDRMSGVKDSSGNIWWMATHIEDVSPEELQKRAAALMK